MASGLTLAALGAGFGGWLGWRGAPPLPDNGSAVVLASQLADSRTVEVVQRQDAVFAYEDPGRGLSRVVTDLVGTDDYNSGYVQVSVQNGGDPATALAGMRERMLGQGWRVESIPWLDAGFSAERGELAIVGYRSTSETQASVTLEIERSQPRLVDILVIAGYILGLIGGWFGGRRVFNTIRDKKVHGRVVGRLGLAGLALLVPGTVLTTGDLVYRLTTLPDTLPPPAAWGDYLFFGVRGLSTLALVPIAIVVIVCVRRGIDGVRLLRSANA